MHSPLHLGATLLAGCNDVDLKFKSSNRKKSEIKLVLSVWIA